MAETILVTGGAGYIGTHILVELIGAGMQPLVLDNFSSGSRAALERVERLVGRPVPYVDCDVRDGAGLDRVFAEARERGQAIGCVLHLAAKKVVSESVANPLLYYDNNQHGTLVLLQAMQRAGVRRFVFSSSASVYGEPKQLPYTEAHPISPATPYGQSKAMVEQMMRDVCIADPGFSAVTLRYFNPIGAHPSGEIGEDPRGAPDNIFPYITQVAVGRRSELTVYGGDYPTVDGTGVRDYLHVVDLARGHLSAVAHVEAGTGFTAVNLGTGRGTSVLELVRAFEAVSGRQVPYRIAERRPGDIAEAWADPGLVYDLLGWRATHTVEQMCADGWLWQSRNPRGYGGD